jgi:hypothetical protein
MAITLFLENKRFGRLTVLKRDINSVKRIPKWICQCDCGVVKSIKGSSLTTGVTKSCGCLQIGSAEKHGASKKGQRTVEYDTWLRIKDRCYNARNKHFKNYGGRGIVVCDRWLESFENFLEDMGLRPCNYSIDRFPNNDGNYEPSNCRWATKKEQEKNKRTNRYIEHNGKKLTITDWSKIIGISQQWLGKKLKTIPFKDLYEYYTNR